MKLKDRLHWLHPMILPQDSRWRYFIILLTIIIVNIVIMIEVVGSSLCVSVVQGYLAIDDTKTAWINNSFLIFLGMTVPVSIYTARKFGFKLVFFLGLSIFLVGTLLSSLSVNYYEYLAFRSISGIGGGLIFPTSLAILKRAFRGQAQKVALTIYIGLAFGGGLILGSIVGGFYAQLLQWRSVHFLCFYAGLPALVLIAAFMYESDRYPTDSFDIFSFLYFALFLIATLTILSEAKAPWNTLGWRSPFIKGCFFVLLSSFVALIIRYHHTKVPLFALSLFKKLDFSVACLSMSFVGAMFFGSNIVMMFLLEEIFQYERITIGYMIAVFGVSYIVFSAIPSFLGNKISAYFFVIGGLVLLAVSSFLNHALTIQSSMKDIIWLLVLRAAGVGLSLGPLTAMTLRNIPDDLTGQAAAMATIFRQIGGAFGSSAISLIAVMRTAFHDARFGEQVNIYSAKFQNYIKIFQWYAINDHSTNQLKAASDTQRYLISFIKAQSVLASYDDVFYLFGWIFIFLSICVMIAAILAHKRSLSHGKV